MIHPTSPQKKQRTTEKAASRGKVQFREKAEHLAKIDLSHYPLLMRVAEVAEAVCISKQTVYVLIEEGELEVLRFGEKSTRIFKTSLQDYMARQLED